MARSGSSNSGPRHYIRVNLLKPAVARDENLHGFRPRPGPSPGPAARTPSAQTGTST